MHYEFEIAKVRQAELVAEYCHPQEREGVTVQVPNILNRMMMALVRLGSHSEHISQPAGNGRVQQASTAAVAK